MRIKMTSLIGLTIPALCLAESAGAQTINTQVFDTIVPLSYNRGHNVSVTERPRPEYDPVGISAGSFDVLPSLNLGSGYTDNVYLTPTDRKSDGFVLVSPTLRVASNWNVHSLSFDAGANLRRYFDTPSRNEDGWSVGSTGRFDLAPDKSITLAATTRRLYESQFSGANISQTRTAPPVQASVVRANADITMTRLRTVLAADWSRYNYRPAEALDGTLLDQQNRNRDIGRITGHVEYAVTPDAGVFVQVTGMRTSYDTNISPGVANRDSSEYRVLVGVSADVTALMRGSIGIGYVSRKYRSDLYSDISGLSIDAKLEYFLTQLTTISLAARRQIEDSAVTGSSGYWNNGVTFRVDHELLRNLLLNAGVDYERDTYRGTLSATGTTVQAIGGADYFLNNIFGLNTRISYARRTNDNSLIGPRLHEFRFTAGVTIRR